VTQNSNEQSDRIFNWHKLDVIDIGKIQEGIIQEVTVSNKQIAVLKRMGNIFAFAAKCPHAGARLCDGWLDVQGRIVCPDHKYRFDPSNGRNISGEGYKLVTYPVQIRGEEIWIGLLATV
jgi:3-phenylpropionate/trans-cinnamate dioxygenase ferredoxin subunit